TIGDGLIVCRSSSSEDSVFTMMNMTDSGTYAGETRFITSEKVISSPAELLMSKLGVKEIAPAVRTFTQKQHMNSMDRKIEAILFFMVDRSLLSFGNRINPFIIPKNMRIAKSFLKKSVIFIKNSYFNRHIPQDSQGMRGEVLEFWRKSP
ncbi:MAG: hypothetical protein II916_01325, partial [Oscillospiraceae bacterium]|nr:hypothetical protein [Oscillospiraceae bacterium]